MRLPGGPALLRRALLDCAAAAVGLVPVAAAPALAAVGNAGRGALLLHMDDDGPQNAGVGHRSFLLSPTRSGVGLGDIDSGAGWNTIQGGSSAAAPATRAPSG